MSDKTDLRGLTQNDLEEFVKELGLPGFRGRQIFAWLYRPGIRSFEQMTDLPLDLRQRLAEVAEIPELELCAREESEDGTVKYGFQLADGQVIEAVLIPDEDRHTLCVSSQVGCAMSCQFCLTGTMGFTRNLQTAEMVDQVYQVQEELLATLDTRINNLVFMGMGEPLANFDNLIDALDILVDQRGLDFSERRITVSTAGLVPRIQELGQKSKVNLAISLHATTDEVRDRLMPINKTYPLSGLIEACKGFPMPKRKRIMIEYILLDSVNDSDEDARRLAKLLRGVPCKINLLPYNECADLPFQRPSRQRVERFQEIVRQAGYTILIRESRGADISAACGQLASEENSIHSQRDELMKTTVIQLYRKRDDNREYCFNIETTQPLDDQELLKLRLLLADGFVADTVATTPFFQGERVVEVGPRMNFATAWSSNMVSICTAAGLPQVSRVERSRRYLAPEGADLTTFTNENHDRMTECPYPAPLTTFETGVQPEEVYDVPLKERGPDALLDIPGISMDDWDRNFYYDYFVGKHDRNPTIVEIMDLNNANSEHSRHGYFRGKQVIDGEEMDETLLEIVIDTLKANPSNSIIAFKDNSSGITGRKISTILPEHPGKPSGFSSAETEYHVIFTAETHNFPTGVAPFPGAETGTGGRIRDIQGTGKGGLVVAGTAGYCVANLHIPGYEMGWEEQFECPSNLASALEIEIEASNGASDYGNKFGEPMIQGFTRSFDMRLANGERWGFLKPIMFTGGIGQIDSRHTEKGAEETGHIIVQVGGPAYRVGFGGGAASSMLQGDNVEALDFNAVQRGDAEMEQKMNRVIRACNEMGDKTLIEVIHDQGAGGPGNVLKELVEHSGGRIGIRKIKAGDPTMSVLEIYVAEFQERNGFLISPANIEKFQAICEREKVNCEVLGQVTGDLRFVVEDESNNTTPVDLDLQEVLGNIPQKTFEDTRRKEQLPPLNLADDLTVESALHDVLRLVSVGSKRFLTNKVDRAVTGLIAGQQCCGPLQLTVADVAVVAQSHFGASGAATAIGEQPIKMLVDPAAGARMAVGEALSNIVWAKIDGIESIKCSANWMWAPKLEGEGAAIYDAAVAMRDTMITLGVAVDGGKDSLSMATRVGEETVKSPRELVISAYASMEDVTRVATPDLKAPGSSSLILIDLGTGSNRLGGSALAQVQGQLGNKSADLDDPALVRRSFEAVQELLAKGLIQAGHDRSDGGLITTLLEMAFSGNCGISIETAGKATAVEMLFSEELGLVFECLNQDMDQVEKLLSAADLPWSLVGRSTEEKQISVVHNGDTVLDKPMIELRQWWEETSYQLERLQMNPTCADQEKENIFDRKAPAYSLSFTPEATAAEILAKQEKPKVAILRDEGSNSDREMTSAFYAAGFEPWDIAMSDLLAGKITLEGFQGLAAVGGFSYADVPESAKGWAATIQFNDRLRTMFDEFYNRPDTFTLGICNGCQLFGLLGWIPWRDIEADRQPRFVRNISGRFESRWSTVKVLPSKAMMLQGMEDLVFGIHVDHGEGRLEFPDPALFAQVKEQGLAAMAYVDDQGQTTESYPFNPNGSPEGLTALCSPDGRHLAMMPHPERTFLTWQAHWLPKEMKDLPVSPWLKMFQNAYQWCISQK